MPRRNIDLHFEKERPEWTRRKHELLERYVMPAAMKLQKRAGVVALVDGYAGANAYGDEATGSTVIMLKAARAVRAQDHQARVYACEPNKGRYGAMLSNLSSDISEGLLKPYNTSHGSALPLILEEIGDVPTIVFLDPQTVTQMTLNADIRPWVNRRYTDILGVFMAGHACRCCGQVLNAGTRHQVPPEAYLGPSWRSAITEEGAFNSFFASLGDQKRFKGMYRLRKMEPRRYAYGIFGLSDHADGLWLLSNAVAKDHGLLENFDYRNEQSTSLFADDERESKQADSFSRLVEIARATILKHQKLRGAKLASFLFDKGIGIDELFGAYEERDFTKAANHVLGRPDRSQHAKAKRD